MKRDDDAAIDATSKHEKGGKSRGKGHARHRCLLLIPSHRGPCALLFRPDTHRHRHCTPSLLGHRFCRAAMDRTRTRPIALQGARPMVRMGGPLAVRPRGLRPPLASTPQFSSDRPVPIPRQPDAVDALIEATPLPIYAEAMGPLKAIGYVEEGRLTPAQVERVRRAGNVTDGKYVWNNGALARLLAANARVFGGGVDDFVLLVRGRQPIDDPRLLCLVHAAFLDHRSYAAQPCTGSSAVVLPPAVNAYMAAVMAHGAALAPEDAWVVPLVAAPAQWARLFTLLDGLQRQADDCRRALYGRGSGAIAS